MAAAGWLHYFWNPCHRAVTNGRGETAQKFISNGASTVAEPKFITSPAARIKHQCTSEMSINSNARVMTFGYEKRPLGCGLC